MKNLDFINDLDDIDELFEKIVKEDAEFYKKKKEQITYSKILHTYIFDTSIKADILESEKPNAPRMSGKVEWIGNRIEAIKGVELFISFGRNEDKKLLNFGTDSTKSFDYNPQKRLFTIIKIPLNCPVCEAPISPKHDTISCPNCKAVAHKDHFLEYLRVHGKCPKCKSPAKRETDTMDTFVDSSWYFLRYCDNKNNAEPFDKKITKYWMPVDQYIGGIEHACMHLIYARFFTKALRDLNLLKIDEPFSRLLCQGMVIKEGAKMSKSLGNVVDPGEIINKYGSDTARLFILFAALPEKELDWNDKGVGASHKFLKKIVTMSEGVKHNDKLPKKLSSKEKSVIGRLHKTIKKVTQQINDYEFNMAIASIMDLTNNLNRVKKEIKRL